MNEPKYKSEDKFLLSFPRIQDSLEKIGVLTDDSGHYDIIASFNNSHENDELYIGIKIIGKVL